VAWPLLATGLIGSARAQSDPLPRWIVADPAAKSVRLSLEVGRLPGAGSASLNGEHDGSVQINVPLG
jgi:hypothetical protein